MELNVLADISLSRRYSCGEVIIRENDEGTEMFYIIRGKAAIYKNYQNRDEVWIATVGVNEFFGEMTLFLNQKRSATVVALEDLEVLVINSENSLSLFRQKPEIAVKIISTLCERLTNMNSSYSQLHGELKLDSFTKLYNRGTFDNLLSYYVEQFKANPDKIFSLLIFDIDKFKRINDTYGHDFGDIVILSLVSTIKSRIRSSDYAFRYGGEEFAVIVSAGEKRAHIIAERIRTDFEKRTFSEWPKERFSVSGGICECYSNMTPLQLFQAADEALLHAKNTGRNRIVIADKK